MTKPSSSQWLSANDAVHNRGKSVVVTTTDFIANTDFGWFSHFLHRAEPPDEVNFWQPSPHGFKAIPAGAPFFSVSARPTGRSPAMASSRATNACRCGSPRGTTEMSRRIAATGLRADDVQAGRIPGVTGHRFRSRIEVAMAKPKARQLKVFLLKETVTSFESAINRRAAVTLCETVPGLPFRAQVCVGPRRLSSPKWLDFLSPQITDKIPALQNSTTSAVLFVEAADRLFALAFGYGRSLLDPDSYVRDFGLRVVLNTVDPEALRSMDVRNVEELTVTTRRQTSRASSLETFGVDPTRDLMRAVAGKPRSPEFARQLAGADTLAITVPIEARQLGEKCAELLAAYRDDAYKEHFGFIDHLSRVHEPGLRDRLDGLLEWAIRERDFERLYLAPPEPLDWTGVEGFTYSDAASAEVFSDLNIDDFISSLRDPDSLTVQRLRRCHVGIRFPETDQSSDRWSVYSCIVWEVEADEQIYVLCEGEWYAVAKSFADRVRQSVSDLSDEAITMPAARLGEHEDIYNERAAAEAGYLCLHKHMFKIGGPRDKMELCDLLTPTGQLVHVKRKSSSATLSHLFAQGRVAGEELAFDDSLRQQVVDAIRSDLPKLAARWSSDSFRPSDVSVVYAVIAKPTSDWPLSLPFFTQLNASNSGTELRRRSLGASLVRVDAV